MGKKEYIEREAALNALSRGRGCGNICSQSINRIPAADVAPKSEVAREIFDEFSKLLDEFLNRKILCAEFMARFVELTLKYTEEKE